jgi:hypothetical protein
MEGGPVVTIQIREELADVIEGIAVENQSTYTGFGADLADASSIDEEENFSEVAIRERLIEWLVGFLPGDSGGNQGSP